MDTKLQWNSGGCPVMKLANHQTNESVQVQGPVSQLYQDCRHQVCTSSVMNFSVHTQKEGQKIAQNVPNYDKAELIKEATQFLTLFYDEKLKSLPNVTKKRLEEANVEIEQTGSIRYNYEELKYGCQLSWRNAARCINRLYWQTLEVVDKRDLTSNEEMFHSICEHIKTSFNKGNLKASVLVLPEKSRVWTSQFLRFACYQQDDGSLLGDPMNRELTKVAMKLGWSKEVSERTQWDLLPIIVQWNMNEKAEWFELPEECKPIIHLSHPDPNYDKVIKTLGLRWVAQPFVADKAIEIGGILHTGVPFSGWFMGTEIGRNLCDIQRYNFIPKIAELLDLDINNAASSQLNIDRIYVEINAAVLHSFQKAKITIVDHHNAAAGFMKFMKQEVADRGNTPADWIWIVPPVSSGMNVTFHQEMINYVEKPCILDQEVPWTNYNFKQHQKNRNSLVAQRASAMGSMSNLWSAVRVLTKFVGLSSRIRKTRTLVHVLYASVTGTAQSYAEELTCKLLKEGYQINLQELDNFDIGSKGDVNCTEPIVALIVTSTFGEGNAPSNGLETEDWVLSQQKLSEKLTLTSEGGLRRTKTDPRIKQSLDHLYYSVCAIGSTAYTNYCQFGISLNQVLLASGAHKMSSLGICDALDDQYKSYCQWQENALSALMSAFPCIKSATKSDNIQTVESRPHFSINQSFNSSSSLLTSESPKSTIGSDLDLSSVDSGFLDTSIAEKVNLQSANHIQQLPVAKYTKDKPFLATVLQNDELVQPPDSEIDCSVRMIEFESGGMKYAPGDHVFVFPENPPQIVNSLISRCGLNLDDPILETQFSLPSSAKKQTFTLRELVAKHIDLLKPMRPNTLEMLIDYASADCDKSDISQLCQDHQLYSDWSKEVPTVLETLEQFPSVQIPLEELIKILPPIQPRPYSISSSAMEDTNKIQITVRVTEFETVQGTKRHGMCSNFLKKTVPQNNPEQTTTNTANEPSKVRIFVSPNTTFRLPGQGKLVTFQIGGQDLNQMQLSSNMMFFAVGSGIAPFRSFWRELLQLKKEPNLRKTPNPKRILFFGCRTPNHFLYGEEICKMQRMPSSKIFTEVIPVYSRSKTGSKEYVQDRILKHSQQIYDMLTDNNSFIYMCGSTKACQEIEKRFVIILRSMHHVGMSSKEAKDWLYRMKRDGRISLEMFG